MKKCGHMLLMHIFYFLSCQGTSPATVSPTCTAVLHVSVTTCPTNPTTDIDKIPAPSKALKGFDDGAAIVVPVVVVTIIVTLILIYNRQKFKKLLGLLVEKPSHDTSTEHSFHNATFQNTEAVSTNSGYDDTQLGNEDQIMTEGNSSEYLTIDLVWEKVNTSSCMYVGVGTNILPVSNNTYAHLKNDSKFRETDNDYTHTNSHSIRHQTKETQMEEYACAVCDNTSKSSKMQCKTKSLNEQDAMYSRLDTRIKNKNNYSHIQKVSTSNTYSKGSSPQTPKETDKGNERLYQEKNYYIDSVTESEYKEPSHEYFILEPPGEVKENNKSTDIAERKIEPDVFKKLTDKNGDEESESSHDYFILEPQICK